MKFLVLIACCLFPAAYCFCQLPDCDIWLLDIKDSAGQISFHNALNITNRKGYDNQPAFSPDGKYILYSSQKDSAGQTDIYKYDIKAKTTIQFTRTPISEYSPTFMPDGKNISAVIVEKDSVQRLQKFPSQQYLNSSKKDELNYIMKNVDSIGYHCWINDDSIAVFILTKPSFTLQIANIHTQKMAVIADSIGRCMRMKDGALWFTIKSGRFNSVYEYHIKSKNAYLKGVIEGEDYCFYDKDQVWSCSDNSIVTGYMNSKAGASEVVNLETFGITKPTRITISPDRKKLAVVSNK